MSHSSLIVVFFLSGAAALLFENLWFHQASLAFGSSVWASSLVLAAFMGGLALGNAVVAGSGWRITRPVRVYVLLEVAIGLTGLALVHLLPEITPLLARFFAPILEEPWLVNPARMLLGFVLMLVPASAMGATLPLLVAALYERDPHFGRVLGRLYGWNTLGAVAGALAGPYFTVALLGVRGSAWLAAGLNVLAAIVAFGFAGRLERISAAIDRPLPRLSLRAWALLGATFVSGAVLLGLEVVWFRFLLLFVRGTGTAFATMLAVVLCGIALGGLAGARWLSVRPDGYRDAPFLAGVAGVLTVALYVAFEGVLGTTLAARPLTSSALLMLPVALLSGVLFTLIGDALHRESGEETRSAGLLTLANTLGGMLGPLLAGFFVLPMLGVEQGVRVFAAGYLAVAILALPAAAIAGARVRRVLAAAAGVALVAATTALFPSGMMADRYHRDMVEHNDPSGETRIVGIRETPTETITYLESEAWGLPNEHTMLTNGHSMSGTSLIARRYMRLYVQWPVAVHPAPRNALLISYGVGVTAKALTDTSELDHIDMVDISRGVLEMNSIVYPDPNDLPTNDPRVTVHIEDGRHYLQTTDRHYDIITGEPPPPKLAGIVNLYTREYFSLVRDRLADGGITTYWLPVHSLHLDDARSITRAFCEAFDDCTLWGGAALNWMLVGTRNASGPVDAARFAAQWRDPVVGQQLRDVGLELPEQLGALFMSGREDLLAWTSDVQPLTDDHPKRLSDRGMLLYPAKQVFSPFMETTATRERFARSELIRRLWPAELREASLSWFDLQSTQNRFLLADLPDDAARLELLVDSLGEPGLRTLTLWFSGSAARLEDLAWQADERGRKDVELDYHLGISHLVDERYADAADRLAGPMRAGHRTPWSTILEILSLCRAGDTDAGRQLLRGARIPTEVWDRLRDACASANATEAN